jgi:Dna[CI] antecedent, DciA
MEKAAATLPKVIADALRRVPPDEAPVSAWPFACGSSVALRTRALEFSGRVLRVEVPDQVWRAQLMELAPRYLAALNSIVGHTVERIQFVLPGEQSNTQPRSAT